MELSFHGEWQKSCFARAYERCASFNLDEPTAALDARAEYEVFQRFAELTKGKSAVLISHRFYRPSCRSNFSIRKWNAFRIWYAPRFIKADGKYAELLIYKQEVINNKMIIF
jgi:ATP-binding cassette subfamily B protein